eukprot:scaffold57761_cov62-Phaeocystis_antarctica.AAC.1
MISQNLVRVRARVRVRVSPPACSARACGAPHGTRLRHTLVPPGASCPASGTARHGRGTLWHYMCMCMHMFMRMHMPARAAVSIDPADTPVVLVRLVEGLAWLGLGS